MSYLEGWLFAARSNLYKSASHPNSCQILTPVSPPYKTLSRCRHHASIGSIRPKTDLSQKTAERSLSSRTRELAMLPSTAAERKLSRLRCGPGPAGPWPWPPWPPWPVLGVGASSFSEPRLYPPSSGPRRDVASQPTAPSPHVPTRPCSFEGRTPSFCPCKQAKASSQGHEKLRLSSGDPRAFALPDRALSNQGKRMQGCPLVELPSKAMLPHSA